MIRAIFNLLNKHAQFPYGTNLGGPSQTEHFLFEISLNSNCILKILENDSLLEKTCLNVWKVIMKFFCSPQEIFEEFVTTSHSYASTFLTSFGIITASFVSWLICASYIFANLSRKEKHLSIPPWCRTNLVFFYSQSWPKL